MSVNLKQLPEDEESVRGLSNSAYLSAMSGNIKNVLDALNWFRCKAKFAEQELERLKANNAPHEESDHGQD